MDHARRKRQNVVLVGGGHAQVFVLRAFGLDPWPDTDLTLITKDIQAPYSGMLPGFVAGHYKFEDCHIDLTKLAEFAGARLIHGSATAIDRKQRQVIVTNQDPVPYDFLSIDVGITPSIGNINGAREYALVVKPVSTFAPKWQALDERFTNTDQAPTLVVVGGGAAGFELALAAKHRFDKQILRRAPDVTRKTSVTLIAGNSVLASHNKRARKLAHDALQRAGITLIEDVAVTEIQKDKVHLADGTTRPADATIVATGAAAAAWFGENGLPVTDDGFIQTHATLQLVDDDAVFAVGDCATNVDHPRPKSGVFAVRQGPPLAENLRRVAAGDPALAFTPQTDFLTLLSLGEKSAIAARGAYAAKGRWAWSWKDWIDQRFMKKFNTPQ